MKKQPIFVQVKNPWDPTTELTASKYGLDSMVTEAQNRCKELGIDPTTGGEPNYRIDLVTFGKGLKPYTRDVKMRHIPIKEIGHKALSQYFGKDNPIFWNRAYEMVAESQPTIGPGKILHTCQNKDNNWPTLFKDTRSVDELNRKHFKLLERLKEEGGLPIQNYELPNRQGDLLELFTICMYRLSETNVKFGVIDYKQTLSDNGLDGEGWIYL